MFSLNIFLGSHMHVFSCLLDVSTWISHRNSKLHSQMYHLPPKWTSSVHFLCCLWIAMILAKNLEVGYVSSFQTPCKKLLTGVCWLCLCDVISVHLLMFSPATFMQSKSWFLIRNSVVGESDCLSSNPLPWKIKISALSEWMDGYGNCRQNKQRQV